MIFQSNAKAVLGGQSRRDRKREELNVSPELEPNWVSGFVLMLGKKDYLILKKSLKCFEGKKWSMLSVPFLSHLISRSLLGDL